MHRQQSAYKIIVGEETLNKIKTYHTALIRKEVSPGIRLNKFRKNKLWSDLTTDEFVQALIHSKLPVIAHEQDMLNNLAKNHWNHTEFDILSGIHLSVAAKTQSNDEMLTPQQEVIVMFTHGLSLIEGSPVRNKVVNPDGSLNLSAYMNECEKKFLCPLKEVNDHAGMSGALINLAGMEAEIFAAEFAKDISNMSDLYFNVMHSLLKKYAPHFPNIKGIIFGPALDKNGANYPITKALSIQIGSIKLMMQAQDSLLKDPINPPEAYDATFKNCKLYHFVASFPVAKPCNRSLINRNNSYESTLAYKTNLRHVLYGDFWVSKTLEHESYNNEKDDLLNFDTCGKVFVVTHENDTLISKLITTVIYEHVLNNNEKGLAQALVSIPPADLEMNFPPKGATALIASIILGNINMVEMLLDAGASIDHADNENNTPLAIAILEHETHIRDELIIRGANLDIPNHQKKTPRDLIESLTEVDMPPDLDNLKKQAEVRSQAIIAFNWTPVTLPLGQIHSGYIVANSSIQLPSAIAHVTDFSSKKSLLKELNKALQNQSSFSANDTFYNPHQKDKKDKQK